MGERMSSLSHMTQLPKTLNNLKIFYLVIGLKFKHLLCRLVETEKLLLDIVEFSMLQLNDFPQKLAKKIEDAINVDISPLMLKKHPIFVNTVDSVSAILQFELVKC